MNIASPSQAVPDTMLSELASIGMRAARTVARLMEIEQAAADIVAAGLVAPTPAPVSLEQAVAAGQSVDAVVAAMEQAVPRIEMLARALDRVSRSVRRSLALLRRMEAGWTGAGRSDDRAAMVRRQVARGVADVIHRQCDDEAAERLFDELAERMDGPELTPELDGVAVDELVRRICRDLGLVATALTDSDSGEHPRHPSRRDPPADTGDPPL